jgi:hypothetical protein
MPLTLLPRPLAALAVVAAVAVPVAGCGSSSSSAGGDAGADPAAALPPSAPIYVEARVRPDGELNANIQTVGRKLLHGRDPGQELVKALDHELRDEGASYQKDIAPWLGDRVGIAVLDLSGRNPGGSDVVGALASKDDEQAQAYVDGRKDSSKREYRGVSYRLEDKPGADGQADAAAVVEGRVLIGSERSVKAAIDATKGDSLAELEAFQEARGEVPADGLGFLYVDPRRAFDQVALKRGSDRSVLGAQAVKGLLAAVGLRAVAASVDVHPDAIVADAALLGVKAQRHGDGPAAAAAVPSDAWLSAGIGDAGGTVQRALSQWSRSGPGAGAGVDPQVLLQQLKSGLGVDVQRDFLSWMGDAAVFAEGTSPATLRGALVVHSKDPAASQRAIGILRRLLPRFGSRALPVHGLPGGASGLRLPAPGLPGGVQIAAKGDLFAIGVGRGVLIDALAPSGRLDSTKAYKTASGLLGGARPALFLNTPKAVALAAAFAGDHAGFRKAQPTLEAFGPAAAGATPKGGVLHVRAGVAVP